MRPSSIPFTVAAIVLVSTIPAAALPFTLVGQEREVYASAGTPVSTTAPDFGPFNEGAFAVPGSVYAIQESTLGLTTVAHLDGRGQGGYARSRLAITFEISEPAAYTLEATLAAHLLNDGAGRSYVRLCSPTAGSEEILWASDRGSTPYQVVETGMLDPGTYTLYSTALGNQGSQGGWGWGQADFTFRLKMMPEPSTAILLLVGSLALMQHRRRV